MCYIALIPLAISAIAAAGTAVQQDQAQKSQLRYQNRVTDLTQAAAAKAAQSDYIALAERSAQVRQAAAQEAFDASHQMNSALGSLKAGSASAGIQGGSVDDLRMTIAQRASQDAAIRMRNQDWQDNQIARSLDKVQAEQQNRANSRYGPQVQGIDYFGLIGSLGSAALSSYDLQSRQNLANRPNYSSPSTTPQLGSSGSYTGRF